MVIDKDFKEFIKLLNDHDVHYLLVGGYAVAFHGHPRYTTDMDIWIEREIANAEKLLNVLKVFGFGSLKITIEDFLNPNSVVQLGNPPNRIDLLSDLSGVDFDTCKKSQVNASIDGIKVSVIDLESLKRNKRATGRFQDLADVENLE